MRLLLFAVLALAGCAPASDGSPAAQRQALGSPGALGDSCGAAEPCSEGLQCEQARGGALCLPKAWFTGVEGGWCFGPADCAAGLICDTAQAPNPIADGACRAAVAQ